MQVFMPNFPGNRENFELIKSYTRTAFSGWFDPFDSMTGGLYEGQTIMIGGATGAGKTSLAVNLARKLGQRCNVVYISTETSFVEIAKRVLEKYDKYENIPPMSLTIFDEDDENAPVRHKGIRFTPEYYNLDNADVILLDYIKSDTLEAVEGSRTMRELVDTWRRFAEKTKKSVVLFTQIRDINVRTDNVQFTDFWLSTSMVQPCYAVLGISRIKSQKGYSEVAVDVIKNRNQGPGNMTVGRFCLKIDTNNCEIIDYTSPFTFSEIKDNMKNLIYENAARNFLGGINV